MNRGAKYWYRNLLDRIGETSNPAAEIERIANEAVASSIIDERDLMILRHRVPFPGYTVKKYEQIGEELAKKITGQRVNQLEAKTYRNLAKFGKVGFKVQHLPEDYMPLGIDNLPWQKDPNHTRAYNGLLNLVYPSFQHPPTVQAVIEKFQELADKNKRIKVKNLGKIGFATIYDVFQNIGIILPKVITY